MMRSKSVTGLMLGSLVLTATAGHGVELTRSPAVQAAAAQESLVAERKAEGIVVVATTGEPVPIPLDREAEAMRIAELAQGWVLTAIVPVEPTDSDLPQPAKLPRVAVVVWDGQESRPLPPLPGPAASPQDRPEPLVFAGRLEGMAWLEGPDPQSLELRFADWDGDRWGDVEVVSRPRRGSQMALRATTLADGRPLAVWTRFNGDYDDVVWSVRDGGVWSRPAAVHSANEVPDILPTVLATADGGAVAAWSQLVDEHYRLQVSRFDGRQWGMSRILPGQGAIGATLVESAGRLLLAFSTVKPRAWWAVELDRGSGRVLRSARLERGLEPLPAVEATADGVTFRWSGAGPPRHASWREGS